MIHPYICPDWMLCIAQYVPLMFFGVTEIRKNIKTNISDELLIKKNCRIASCQEEFK